MGNSPNEKTKLVKSPSPNDDFLDSSLDIYLFGNYNPIMDIIIGETTKSKKRNEDYINIHGYEYNDNKDYVSIEQTPMDEEDNLNSLNERLIIKNGNNSNNNNYVEINFNKFLKNFKSHKNKIMSEEPYKVKHPVFKWNLNFYCKGSLNLNYLSKVRDNFEKDFYDEQKNVLVLFIDNINTIFNIINIFSKINSEKHPLFLFIIKIIDTSKTIKQIELDIGNYVKNKKIKHFNLRNVTLLEEVDLFETPKDESYNLNKKNDYIISIYSFLINSWLYYNNLGDNFEFGKYLGPYSNKFLEDINNEKNNININSHIGLFNIMVVGKPGTGKSTLINILSKNKRSLEGRGESGTKKIIKFIIKDYNISLYDTPGFELDKDINKIIKLINNLQNHLIQGRHQINMVFYLISGGARDFYENEKGILKILMEKNIPTFFLLTFSPNLQKGNEFKQIVEINLRRTLKQLDKDKGMKYYKQQVKVFPVHLLDENDGSCSNFGIKTFMEAAFEKFKNCIVEENDLEMLDNIMMDDYQKDNSDDKPSRTKEIFNLIEGKEIYKYFKDIDDILTSSVSQSNSVISHYSKYGFGLSFLNFLFIPSFIYLKNIKKSLLNELLIIFKKVMDEKEKEELITDNLKKINDYNNLIGNFPIVSMFYNYQIIKEFGNKYVQIFKSELEKAGIDGLSTFIKKFIQCYNNAINGLKEIGQNFNE